MNLRKLGGLLLLCTGLTLSTGCESTTNQAGGDGSTLSQGADIQREGGNVRSTTFLPPMPSEINEADFRYW